MHRPSPKRILPALLLVLLALAAWYFTRGNPSIPANGARLSGSGTIQADEYIVAGEIAGRLIGLAVDEGDTVQAGQPLAQLDAALLSAQLDQADAALTAAQANLAKIQAGTRPEEIQAAQAALAQALARRDAATVALADAQAARATPQELNVRIDAARAALAAAEHRALSANLLAQSATLERDYYQRTLAGVENGLSIDVQTPQGRIVRTFNVRTEELRSQLAAASGKEWNAWSAQDAAFAQRDGARADLQNLLTLQSKPMVLNAQVDAARAQVDTAQAAVRVAQAKLDALKAGPRAENVAAALAQVTQARAARDSIQSQLKKMTLVSPGNGLVNQRFLNLGEMAAPGSAVFHVANLDTVTLTVYLPENRIGQVQVGAPAQITVDSFPDRVFMGTVSFISLQAEFTPKNIATQDQRSTQVFAVKIRIDNPDDALKPGMPADAVIK